MPVVGDSNVSVITQEQYESLFRQLLRDQLTITLHPRQRLSFVDEELKILVQSIQTGTSANAQKIALKALSSGGDELSFTELPGERLTLVTGNERFFVLYTNRQQVHVFSSTTFELIQRGLLIEGGCMLAENVDTA